MGMGIQMQLLNAQKAVLETQAEKNKAEALEWCHDDMIMADAICYQMRNERIWLVDVSPVVSPWNKSFISVWELEDDINARYAHLYK